jgi:hypothetical protein
MPLRDRFSGTGDLYSHLKDAVLQDYLGKYLYEVNNVPTEIPAIYIVKNRDKDPPSEWTRSGIECLIFKPTLKPRQYLTSNGVVTGYRFRLIQHDRSQDLNPAKEWIIRQLPSAIEESHLDATIDRAEQLTYSIRQIKV